VTDQVPEQDGREITSRPVIHLHLETGMTADSLGPLLNRMRRLPGADVIELTVCRVDHPAMPGAVLADVVVLTPAGVYRVRRVGRTPDAAIERVRAVLAGQ
jgi:hypothetical protein